jgi:hypothetical protein
MMLPNIFIIIMCVEVMTEQLPDLLEASFDVGHHCHQWLVSNAHFDPPQTFRLRSIKNRFHVHDRYMDHLRAHGLLPYIFQVYIKHREVSIGPISYVGPW